ncbi:unnamed protein product [Oncorhynchus mykiss]|uniref:Uncharacterized protein n=1 Tax=Oncorhynchus mykiss TaxID=8022 RepID=A0A060YNC6_ONCMY|nr:unnamed protein product [Oncorhynchus mykiss]
MENIQMTTYQVNFFKKILFHIFHIFASFVKKVFNVSCCYNCTPYDKGPSLTAGVNQHDCFKCPNGTWSLKEWTHWKPGGTTVIPLPWCLRQMFEVVLLFIIFIIFLVHKEYLPMKRAEVIGWAISKFCERYLIHRQTEPLCKAWASHCVSPAF